MDISQSGEWGEEGSADIPLHYYAQVQHQIDTLGVAESEVAALIGGNRLKLYLVPRDDEFIRAMREQEAYFWRCIETRTPPEPLTIKEAGQRWGKSVANEVFGTDTDLMAAKELIQVTEEIKQLEDRADRLGLILRESIKDIGDTLVVYGQPIATWKTQKTKRLDGELIKTRYPTVAEECVKETESRVFRLNKKNVEKAGEARC